jgi:hypothetical protein
MAVEIKFLIDNLDRGQPLNPEDFGINITTDDAIGARIVSFDNELIFGGDVFGYLYNKLATSGYCELVRVTVQYLCSSGTWEKLVDGYIIVTESTFDLDKCQVKTKLYDETFSTKINNNKAIPFALNLTTSKNGETIVPPNKRKLRMFTPSTGVTDSANPTFGYAIYDVFSHLVACMSDGLVDFASNYFYYNPTPPPNLLVYTFAYTTGFHIRTKSNDPISASFENVYNALRQKLNLGIGFEKQSNGRPLLRVEPISYFQQSTASANLYDQSAIEMKFDTSKLYQAAEFGNQLFLEQGQCNGGNTPCEFTQTVFRGFRPETFGFAGECNTSNILKLKTDEVIFDTNVIEDIFVHSSENYETNPAIIQVQYFPITLPTPDYVFSARKFDPYNFNQNIYNGDFTNDNVSANWINGYPNTLNSFLGGISPSQTIFNVQSGFGVNSDLYLFNNTFFQDIKTANGNYAVFLNEITDNGNNFTFDVYTVPAAGIYSFSALMIWEEVREGAPPFNIDPVEWGRQIKLRIEHYDSAGTAIGFQTSDAVTLSKTKNWREILNYNIVCNTGDKVVVNCYTQRVSTAPFDNLQRFEDNSTFPEGFKQSYFSGFGQPFGLPNELQPVDINDVQAYLYKFKRPLTMAEINAITSETSKPIQLGRRDDSLAVIDTYIKNIQIESVMRKAAQFELRSNKLLP